MPRIMKLLLVLFFALAIQGCFPLMLLAPQPRNYVKFDLGSARKFLDGSTHHGWILTTINPNFFLTMFPQDRDPVKIIVTEPISEVPFEKSDGIWRRVFPAEKKTIAQMITPCLPWMNCERFTRHYASDGYLSVVDESELRPVDNLNILIKEKTIAFASFYLRDARNKNSVDFSGNWIYFSGDGIAIYPMLRMVSGRIRLKSSNYFVLGDTVCLSDDRLCFRAAQDHQGQAYLVQSLMDDKGLPIREGIVNQVVYMGFGDSLNSVDRYKRLLASDSYDFDMIRNGLIRRQAEEMDGIRAQEDRRVKQRGYNP